MWPFNVPNAISMYSRDAKQFLFFIFLCLWVFFFFTLNTRKSLIYLFPPLFFRVLFLPQFPLPLLLLHSAFISHLLVLCICSRISFNSAFDLLYPHCFLCACVGVFFCTQKLITAIEKGRGVKNEKRKEMETLLSLQSLWRRGWYTLYVRKTKNRLYFYSQRFYDIIRRAGYRKKITRLVLYLHLDHRLSKNGIVIGLVWNWPCNFKEWNHRPKWTDLHEV